MPERVIPIKCSSCKGVLFLALTLTRASNQDGQRFEVTCPLCAAEFPIGWVTEFRIKPSEPSSVPSTEVQKSPGDITSLAPPAKGVEAETITVAMTEDDDLASGRSPNDDRSDALNPNNPAHQAAGDNRSNQLNPNNPAYDSSRGHGRR